MSSTTTIKFRTWDAAGNPEPVARADNQSRFDGAERQLASPADGASLAGAVTVRVEAIDSGAGVSNVELFADGDYLDYFRGHTSPYELVLAAGRTRSARTA